jgi:hypothetical protein
MPYQSNMALPSDNNHRRDSFKSSKNKNHPVPSPTDEIGEPGARMNQAITLLEKEEAIEEVVHLLVGMAQQTRSVSGSDSSDNIIEEDGDKPNLTNLSQRRVLSTQLALRSNDVPSAQLADLLWSLGSLGFSTGGDLTLTHLSPVLFTYIHTYITSGTNSPHELRPHVHFVISVEHAALATLTARVAQRLVEERLGVPQGGGEVWGEN